MEKTRIYSIDNIKFILIFFVVLGHLLEIAQGWGEEKEVFYRLIYSFHMPVFMFFTGWFAKFRRDKIVFHLMYMYLFFQIAYQMFNHYFIAERLTVELKHQFTTPYWLLWYLLAIIFYHILIPLLDVEDTWKQVCIVLLCFVVSLISGNDNTVGYYFSLGRFFSFLPFFTMGYYVKNWQMQIVSSKSIWRTIILSVLAIVVIVLVTKYCDFPNEAFYGSYSYEKLKMELAGKLTIELIAIFWIMFFLFAVAPFINYRIPLISNIGKNSLSVFLLHGFIIRWMQKEELGQSFTPFYTVLCAFIIVVALGNTISNKLFHWLCTGWWLEKIHMKIMKKMKINSRD